ncbi:MAG: 4-hydroxyproline epimerase [Alphaproteobacteria bacterium]|jgi:4-hydroxyproline epimerase|nr:4-hydroxyproline epimerase [Alphaproteobacteria bacterium]MDP6516734.1 4-hydroxyproline epimerase [Alphaproteobacteria bacterium]|tara:strand:- start:45 stop:1040 length:996 start_codon:yes stop_codon:yes gene_type:complete
MHTFFCIDGHTCGNPVRVVAGGGPVLVGATMSARRQDFIANHDWIRRALMFEPRGHDLMSGAILYPPLEAGSDLAVLYLETTGCLPMCGHGTIGTVTAAIEHGQVAPAEDGRLCLDTPAGTVGITYRRDGRFVDSVRLFNVASYVAATEMRIDCPELGALTLDVAYGGNFYAIIDPQPGFGGLDDLSVSDILRFSPLVRDLINGARDFVHPEDETIRGVSHVMWTGAAKSPGAAARNAVFYGARAIDRSPCGTGTSARMAQWVHRGRLALGDDFVHESIIGSLFEGRIEAAATVGNHPAIRPSISGWARITGLNTILVDDRDPYAHGFQVV